MSAASNWWNAEDSDNAIEIFVVGLPGEAADETIELDESESCHQHECIGSGIRSNSAPASAVLHLSVELCRTTMSILDLSDLRPGSLVVLDRLAGQPLDLVLNDVCVARGEVVVLGDKLGLAVTEVKLPTTSLAVFGQPSL